jgi:hypothetical protein
MKNCKARVNNFFFKLIYINIFKYYLASGIVSIVLVGVRYEGVTSVEVR